MGKIVRYITTDGSAFVIAGDTTDMVSEAENIHKTSAVTTAAPAPSPKRTQVLLSVQSTNLLNRSAPITRAVL